VGRVRLAGKAGVVTGSASGLGRETLLALAAEGARIVGLDRDADGGSRVVEACAAAGGTAVFHEGDVTREEDVVAAIARCRAEFGSLDVMVNNAGIAVEARLHETTNEQFETAIAVNLRGTFWGCKHAVTAMRESGAGSIVNVGSIVSVSGDPILPVYAMTKHGILGLTRVIAVDYAAEGIRCNCICPGDMETPMIERTFAAASDPAAARRAMEAEYPGKRIGDPKEVAAAVVFLASDESSFVNGAAFMVDGGLTASVY
jgi:NAD(P)-dependent dehydrogenase (short-subunit alcohol dehydrogenase family)